MRQRYFQWIKGDYKGQVVILDYITQIDGETYYQFNDGERCNIEFISPMTDSVKDLRGKLMVEIDSLTNPWEFYTVEAKIYKDQSMNGEENEIPSLHDILQAHGQTADITNSDIGQEKIRPPKRKQNITELPNPEDYPAPKPQAAYISSPTQQETYILASTDDITPIKIDESNDNVSYVPPQPQTFDPVKIFVDSCKKHETTIDLSITVNLPSSSLYNIAESEFEDGGDKFVNYIIQDLDINSIIESLREALKATYISKISEKSEINTEN